MSCRSQGGKNVAFELRDLVPWARSFDEYVAMFVLSEADLGKRILGCGDDPASINAELTSRGVGWHLLHRSLLTLFRAEGLQGSAPFGQVERSCSTAGMAI